MRKFLILATLGFVFAFHASVMAQAPAKVEVGSLVIEAPWARATPGGAKVAGGYVKITNKGTQSDRLVGGSLAGAREVEVHEMSMSNNVMKMRHLKDGLEIKPGQTVELKPGGYRMQDMVRFVVNSKLFLEK